MAKHITRWYPDTCGCVVDYEWDDTEIAPEEGDITYTLVDSIKCPIHETEVDIMSVVRNENTTKNRVIGKIVEIDDTIKQESIGFEYDNDRHLTLFVPGVNGAKITKLRNAINKDYDGVTINGS
jgi:hypothetical protein